MKWKKNAIGISFIDAVEEFREQTKIINNEDSIISPKKFGYGKSLIGGITHESYIPDAPFPDDTFYDALSEDRK